MKTESNTLSLWQATLITLNIMFGSGVLINTVNLIKITGFFGFLSYIIVALCLLPLIVCIMRLVHIYPSGGFYQYAAAELSPWWGFVSAWSYFVGKLASATLLIHVFTLAIQTIVLPLRIINPYLIDCLVLVIFTWLNYYGLKTGARISYFFLILKLIPVLFIISTSIYLIGQWHIPPESLVWPALAETIPLVSYAFVGFEAACAFSLTINDPKKNAPRVIAYACSISIVITIAYQLICFLAIGEKLAQAATFLDIVPTMLNTLLGTTNIAVQSLLLFIIHSAAGFAALGGSYGMIFSNAWNLYILAENKQIAGADYLSKKNNYNVPFYAVLVELLVCISFLILTGAQQKILQQISILGVTIGFIVSVIALFKRSIRHALYLETSIAVAAFGSCSLLAVTCIRNFSIVGFTALMPFALLLICGLAMYILAYNKKIGPSRRM